MKWTCLLFLLMFVFLVPMSPPSSSSRKANESTPTPSKASPLENNKPDSPKKVVPKEDSQPASPPARTYSQKNNKATGHPAKTGKAPKAAPVGKKAPSMPSRPEPAGSPEIARLPETAGSPERAESPVLASSRSTKHITQWSVGEVVDFIKTTDCFKFAGDFLRQVTSETSFNK